MSGHQETPVPQPQPDTDDTPWPTRMARFVEAGQHLAARMQDVRVAMTDAFRALHQLHAAMQAAGLLPEEHPEEPAPAGRHASRITGPPPNPQLMDAIHDHQARTLQPSASCSTCWPRPCDPARSACHRNPNTANPSDP